MQVLLDGEVVEKDVGKEIILKVVDKYLSGTIDSDRVIKHFFINGIEVDQHLEAVDINIEQNNIDVIEIVTESKAELIYGTIKTVSEYLPKLTFAIHDISSSINLGKEVDKGLWKQVIEGLEWVSSVCSHLYQNNQYLPRSEGDLKTLIDKMKETLLGLVDALESGDLVAVSDILEYELAEQLNILNDIISANLELLDS